MLPIVLIIVIVLPDGKGACHGGQQGFCVTNVFGDVCAPGSPDCIEWMGPCGRMFSQCVLIWSHSLFLFKDTVRIGEGPDTHATVFRDDEMTFRMNR